MSQRGRGALEIKPSNNPFFQTTSLDLGSNPNSIVSWKHDVNPSFLQAAVNYERKENFNFLYKRSSDKIGEKLDKTQQFLPQQPTKAEFLRARRENLQQNMESIPRDVFEMRETAPILNPEQLLSNYKHNPKYEDPRYTLASNEIGRKVPTVATFVAERATKHQEFSRSFNNVKPKNTSLNTSLTKSNIHPKLDPQFV